MSKHPKCNGNRKKLCKEECGWCFSRSFASHPKAKFWSKVNRDSPRECFLSTNSKRKFDCPKCFHQFESALSDITNGRWCPYCAKCGSSKLCGEDGCNFCLSRSFASHPKSKFWSKVNRDSPRECFLSSNKKRKFECPECFHLFESVLNNITSGQWCPFCSNPPQKLCVNEDCKQCFSKSFASHPKAEFWSKENRDSSRECFLSGHKKRKFDCTECFHQFESVLNNIANGGTWCPFCSSVELCRNKECEWCFERSFASHPKSEFWSEENNDSPRECFLSTNSKRKFDCPECFHQFESVLSDITNGRWCLYCANQKLCVNEDCKQCFSKSFASHPKAKFWSKENEDSPRECFLFSTKKRKFNCPECFHQFESMLSSITIGQWCPYCKHKTEKKLLQWLEPLYETQSQARFNWCRSSSTSKHLPFDFLLPSLNIIIELDGPQHFRQISNWAPPEETQQRDRFKEKQAILNDHTVIRILQEDVWNDRNDWENRLKECIDQVRESPSIICLYETEVVYHWKFVEAP